MTEANRAGRGATPRRPPCATAVWRALVDAGVSVGPAFDRIPNFVGADVAAKRLARTRRLEARARRQMQSRSAANPGAPARALRRQAAVRAGALSHQGLPLSAHRSRKARGEGRRLRDRGDRARLHGPWRADRLRGHAEARFLRRRLRRGDARAAGAPARAPASPTSSRASSASSASRRPRRRSRPPSIRSQVVDESAGRDGGARQRARLHRHRERADRDAARAVPPDGRRRLGTRCGRTSSPTFRSSRDLRAAHRRPETAPMTVDDPRRTAEVEAAFAAYERALVDQRRRRARRLLSAERRPPIRYGVGENLYGYRGDPGLPRGALAGRPRAHAGETRIATYGRDLAVAATLFRRDERAGQDRPADADLGALSRGLADRRGARQRDRRAEHERVDRRRHAAADRRRAGGRPPSTSRSRTAVIAAIAPCARRAGTRRLAMPALVNAHDHCAAAVADLVRRAGKPLETWLLRLAAMPAVDPYLAALAAFGRAARGGRGLGHGALHPLPRPHAAGRGGARSRARGGRGRRSRDLRGLHARPQSAGLWRRRPTRAGGVAAGGARAAVEAHFLGADAERRRRRSRASRRSRAAVESPTFTVQFGPNGPQWCSRRTCSRAIARRSRATGPARAHASAGDARISAPSPTTPIPKACVARLKTLGLAYAAPDARPLRPRARPDELDAIAAAGAVIATNPSSNLHLRSGIAPIGEAIRRGCRVALGVDASALDEDDDIAARNAARPFPARRLGLREPSSRAASGSRGSSPTDASPTARRATAR